MASKTPTLKWSLSEYTPIGLKGKTERELRKEYSRLRSIARKRLERLEASEFAETNIVQYNRGRFTPIPQITSESQLRHKLTDVVRFLQSPLSSITGQRQVQSKTIQTLHERGYTMINQRNFRMFTEFMDELRRQKLNRLYDSERVLELFETAENKGIPPSELQTNFQFWLEHREQLKNVPEKINKRPVNADTARKYILKEERAKKHDTGSKSRRKRASN